VAELGEKLRSPLPVVVSKPFQCYYRRAKELREAHSVKWNDVLFFYSLVAAKMTVGCTVKKITGAEPPTKKVAEPPAKKVAEPPAKKKTKPPKQGLFRKGFLNLPTIISVPPASPWEVNTVRVAGPSSPPSGCINGFSQSRNWPVGFDHNGRIVV
jgi:hypothetical protein